MSEQGKSLIESLAVLADRIAQQTTAIQALADSNQQLIRLMAEDEVEQDERDSGGYLSGKADR